MGGWKKPKSSSPHRNKTKLNEPSHLVTKQPHLSDTSHELTSRVEQAKPAVVRLQPHQQVLSTLLETKGLLIKPGETHDDFGESRLYGFEFRGAWYGDDEDSLNPVVQVWADGDLIAMFSTNKVVTLYTRNLKSTSLRDILVVLQDLFGYERIWKEGHVEVWMMPRPPVELAPFVPGPEEDEVESVS